MISTELGIMKRFEVLSHQCHLYYSCLECLTVQMYETFNLQKCTDENNHCKTSVMLLFYVCGSDLCNLFS